MPSVNDERWKNWTDNFLDAPRTRPSKEKTELIIDWLLKREGNSETENMEMDEDFSRMFQFKVARSHASRLKLNIDAECIQLIILLSENIAEIVMYLHAARRLQDRLKNSYDGQIKWFSFFRFCCREGLPTSEQLQTFWEEQKLTAEERKVLGGIDNYLDHVVG